MMTKYFATYNEIRQADELPGPEYVEITAAEYQRLFNGLVNDGKQVWLNNGVPFLRTPAPFGEPELNFEYIFETDFWKRKPPADYDGDNYTYNEDTNTWVLVPEEPEVPPVEPEI